MRFPRVEWGNEDKRNLELFGDAAHISSKNTETATYVVYVVDQYGEPVPDASVTFCTPAACRVMVSDENGAIVFEGAPNAYHLSVIDLPDGYSSDDDDDIYTQVGSSGKTLVVTRDE